MQRLTVSAASVVCRVDRTRWPVSAAARAFLRVSASRISPTRMTSGSWRMAARMAMVKSLVSTRTSRWLTMPSLSAWRTSIGSSKVTMWTARLALTWSIMAARVGGLARPGGPGDQDQAAGLLGQAGDHRGQAQLPDGHRPLLDPAQHHPDRAALAEVQVRPLGGDQRLQPGQHARHRLSPSP